MKPVKRSQLLISVLQVRLMLLSVAYLLTLALVLGAVLFWPLAQRMDDVEISAAERASAASELLALHARFWPAFAIVAATFISHQLIVSHRIAGPLYRIRQVLKAMARGDMPKEVRLRERDLLGEEASELNTLIQALRARLQQTRGSLERARNVAARWDPANAAEQRVLKSELEAALERLSIELDGFDSSESARAAPESSEQPPPALPRAGTHAPTTDSSHARSQHESES